MKVGMLGKGQLGRMMALASEGLCDVQFYEPASEEYHTSLEAEPAHGRTALDAFIESSDVVTYETENTPLALVEKIQQSTPVFPGSEILTIASNRLREKETFTELNIPVPKFFACNTVDDVYCASKKLKFPFILKTCSEGYDGKGQQVFKTEACLKNITIEDGMQYIAEQWIDYIFETSIIAVRSTTGELGFYPMGKNIHRNGILFQSHIVPNLLSDKQIQTAQSYAKSLLERFNYVGVFALELFVTSTGDFIANECAPRVHNSGHWTIEGAQCSQFENHLRAVLGKKLGACEQKYTYVVMQNILGAMPEKSPDISGIFMHDYLKSPRDKRKVGHMTLCLDDQNSFLKALGMLDK